MYNEFYGLREKPFNITSDPNFLFLSRKHKETFSHLLYGIRERKGILEITGEIGTGKTTLARALLSHLDDSVKTAIILNPNLSELQLLEAILEDFGLQLEQRNKKIFLSKLNKFLLDLASSGKNAVLIIDEAQNLSRNQLEQIRLLTNLETEKEKLLQIVLMGQPELREKLSSIKLRQLNQRISVRYHILPLDKDEVKDYIDHRLKVAGSDGRTTFSAEAIEEIFAYSNGIPRLINILCDRALLAGFVLERMDITYDIIKKCINELEGRYM